MRVGATDIPPGAVTVLPGQMKSGGHDTLAELVPLVYKELRRLAGHLLHEERVGHTLQPIALVQEANLCLVGKDRADWQNRAKFIAIAEQIMRRILLQYAWLRERGQAGSSRAREGEWTSGSGTMGENSGVEEALTCLGQLAPQHAYRGSAVFRWRGLLRRSAFHGGQYGLAATKGWLRAELSGEGLQWSRSGGQSASGSGARGSVGRRDTAGEGWNDRGTVGADHERVSRGAGKAGRRPGSLPGKDVQRR